jgi:hypothetical protein
MGKMCSFRLAILLMSVFKESSFSQTGLPLFLPSREISCEVTILLHLAEHDRVVLSISPKKS